MTLTSRVPDLSEVLGGADPGGSARALPGPRGSLPLDAEMLRTSPSGDLFGLTQNAGMGWDPREATRTPYLILSTQGGLRGDDGQPIALGYHTGHWEVGLLVRAAAEAIRDAVGPAVRGLLHRPVRRPHAGHAGNDGQPALSQRRRDRDAPPDPLAAAARGRPRASRPATRACRPRCSRSPGAPTCRA